ncbi:MAG: hypothetical protein ACOYLE_01600 [Bacteroidales bacterium]
MPAETITNKAEIISIAYITHFDENDLKDEIIYSVITKYIIPIVTPNLYKQACNQPDNFQELIEGYIKPCIAFYVKYLHLNQLVLESRNFIPAEYRNPTASAKSAAAEVLIIAEQKKEDLIKFIKIAYLPSPAPLPSNPNFISGFLL